MSDQIEINQDSKWQFSTQMLVAIIGGIITEDSQYWYHTFGASGAFIPKQSLTCDILQIAGGGGGGFTRGGAGGAGGLLLHSAQSLTATSYNVTVGAGGAAGTSGNGGTGVNSQFAS